MSSQKTAVQGLSGELSASLEETTGISAVLQDYFELIKPRIIVLLLISTGCPMILAAEGHVPVATIFYALLGGALVSGSAGVLNCIWDKDIDGIMNRTKNRPLPADRVSVEGAFLYSIFLFVLGVSLLAMQLNWLAASVAIFGHLFYVLIYTIGLKRSSVQNIVIGGAAGAVPPIVGWIGVTGRIDLEAILLFLLIFLWTPPHFWALAINKNQDYQRAGVPMMPVICGEAVTQRQMFWYALALLPVTWLLVAVNPTLGNFSLVVLTLLSSAFAWKVHQLRQYVIPSAATSEEMTQAKTKKAWDIFWFSIIYLALFFICLVVDSILI